MIIDFLNFLSILKTFLIQNDSAFLIKVVPERKSNFFPKLNLFNTISKPILSGVRKAEYGSSIYVNFRLPNLSKIWPA